MFIVRHNVLQVRKLGCGECRSVLSIIYLAVQNDVDVFLAFIFCSVVNLTKCGGARVAGRQASLPFAKGH